MSFSARAAAFVKFWLFSLAIALALLGPGLAHADGFRPFDRIVVFGDSLSDSGNLYAIGLAQDPPIQPGGPNNNWGIDTLGEWLSLIPAQAYVSGRLSNGPTWVELVGTALNRGQNVRPAFATTDLHALNFAVAGATASGLGPLPEQFELRGQVAAYVARTAQIGTTSDTLYVIAIGGNDVRAAADSLSDPDAETTPDTVFTAAINGLRESILALKSKGAQKILLWNAPNLGRSPAIHRVAALGPCAGLSEPVRSLCVQGVADFFMGLSADYNARLDNLLLEGELQGIEFLRFDAFGLLDPIQAHPRRYGLTTATEACIRPSWPDFGVITPFPHRCPFPDRFFFWDGIHPTRAGHAIIAVLVGKELVRAALHDH